MPKAPLELSATDRDYLEALLHKGTLEARQLKRATALLDLDRGKGVNTIADTLGVSRSAVSRWAASYRHEGLSMLHDKARGGRPVEIDWEQRAKVTALACSTPPKGHSRWTLRLLADKAVKLKYCEHLNHTQASEIFKKRVKASFEKDLVHCSRFLAQMEHIPWLYALPYDPAYPVVCFDERPCFLVSEGVDPIAL